MLLAVELRPDPQEELQRSLNSIAADGYYKPRTVREWRGQRQLLQLRSSLGLSGRVDV